MAEIEIAVAVQPKRARINLAQLREGVRTVLLGEGIEQASISLAVVDDAAIHQINRQFLLHDEPTDVISFALETRPGYVDGEIIASAETAARQAAKYGWSPADELLLYFIHGALHLVGYDDLTATARPKMRRRERHYLRQLGVVRGQTVPRVKEVKRVQKGKTGRKSQSRRRAEVPT